MAQRRELTEQDVLEHLARTRDAVSLREIAHALELRHPARRQLQKILARLKRQGEVEEARHGRYRLAGPRLPEKKPSVPPGRPGGSRVPARDANLVTGRIVVHRDGYGFVVPDEPVPAMEGDLYVGADRVGDAMHGDQVLARIERRRPDGRAEGRVVRVVKRAHPSIVGIFRYGPRGNTVTPFETRLRQEIVIPPGEELVPELRAKLGAAPAHGPFGFAPFDSAQGRQGKRGARHTVRLPELDGAVVNVELTRFPRSGVAPAGRVVEVLGRPGDFGVDVEIIIRKHQLPRVFPEEVLAEAGITPQQVPSEALRGREDFRHLPIVTIDGETAKDFDDAVYVARLPGDGYELQVHIADVAHYVRRGSALDREARLRGTSVYFPDRGLPMLPVELSNGICSLNPQVDRLVMSVRMKLDGGGNVVDASFTPGVIRSAERMTYTNVNRVLEGDPEATARYAHLADQFRLMKELALLMNARRNRRGSIDFDLPEPVIEFDELGRMVSIVRSERNIANRIIEEFMLAANEAVARYLEKRGIPSLHRVHEKPDPKKVLEFEEIAHSFGYSLGVADLAERRVPVKHGRVAAPARAGRTVRGRMRPMTVLLPATMELDIRPQHYQRLTQKIAGKPEERILSYLMLRSLKQARYAAEPLGHFALAADHYTHFTSPIRRYPDLIVHRILKWALAPYRLGTGLEHPSASAGRSGFGSDVRTPVESAGLQRPGSLVSRFSASERAPHHAAKRGDTKAPEATLGPYRPAELEDIAAESSEAERRADAAERELMEWKTAQFMEQHLGEEYDALIISVQKFGFFVELMEIFVEGLVPIDHLEEITGERCFYRERDHVIVSERRRRTFRLGDRVRVRAERVDPFFRRVEFALVTS